MSKLIDISRNKQLQRKLLKYNESSFHSDDPNGGGHVSLLQYAAESYDENQQSPHESDMNRGGAPLQ